MEARLKTRNAQWFRLVSLARIFTDISIILLYSRNSIFILLTKTTAAQNEVVLSHHRVRELYFLAVIFAATVL